MKIACVVVGGLKAMSPKNLGSVKFAGRNTYPKKTINNSSRWKCLTIRRETIMPSSNSTMIRKLQIALNSKGMMILVPRSQFYSAEQKRPVTIYKVAQAYWNEDKGRYSHIELFSSASEIQCVLFMRNLWYIINGKEVPPTNRMKGAAEFERKWNEFYEKWKVKKPSETIDDPE